MVAEMRKGKVCEMSQCGGRHAGKGRSRLGTGWRVNLRIGHKNEAAVAAVVAGERF